MLLCIDVIGLMTGISVEKEFVRDGKVTKMLVIEITDQRLAALTNSS